MIEINFYRSESGKRPVEEFLDNLTAKQAKKVVWVLNMVEEHINVPSKYFKKMVNTDNLWEVRVNFGSNIFRIICFFDSLKLLF